MAKINRQPASKAPISKNETITTTIVDLSYQGMGVAKLDHFPIFVANALPGEEVELQATKVLKNYAFGRVVKRLSDSPDRVEVPDKVALAAGIAPLANLAYPAQLKFKQEQVENVFQKLHLDVAVAETIGMEDPTHYRNKAQVPVQMVKGHLATGFYRRGSHTLIPTDHFYIQNPEVDQAVAATREVLDGLGLQAYDEKTKKGLVRHIMARYGEQSGELMVVIVTNHAKLPGKELIIERLRAKLPALKSLIQNINNVHTNVIMGGENVTLWGADKIEDTLLGKTYQIGPNSFYQVNPKTTAKLYQLAAQKADLKPDDVVVDAYCGIGTIALSVADQVKQVYGVEVVPDAIADARENARLNGVDNASFITADAPEQMQKWQAEGLKPSVVFFDPPRKGLTPEVIEATVAMEPERIVYVSCNPATLARDAAQLIETGYHFDGPVQPVDQFPQTVHVEAVVAFKR
ncbi:23S rRNA (uracil(1939)-C(5))-methyltransferase RlmD [Eupransor demetentiae]|uniref:TrmA/RlmC/RlmD family (TrmA) n=1 Tax=Eupransor demetentiae TaxID=3109584 RepID=A0ABP0EN13_9LACO|nr:TrmA/RlmC/RlmD family (TrmA) [Lactobacillaceae bacterium LMG 33000]